MKRQAGHSHFHKVQIMNSNFIDFVSFEMVPKLVFELKIL